jgi:hypothetical protein
MVVLLSRMQRGMLGRLALLLTLCPDFLSLVEQVKV